MKVSIITVVYNSVDTIASCIESVLGQDYEDLEYIVIDGQSTDGTVEVIQQYQEDITWFVSEKDKGIYDALNKGIHLTSGEIVGILNADDLFFSPSVLSEVVHTFQEKNVNCLYGDLVYVDQLNPENVVRTWKAGAFHPKEFLKGWMPPHPTFFIKRACLLENGLYDTSFKISADYELMLRYLYKCEMKVAYLEKNLVRMRVGGVSSGSVQGRLRANREDMLAWKKNNLQPKSYMRWMKPLRKVRQFSWQYYSYRYSLSLALFLPVFMDFFNSTSLVKLKIILAMIFAWAITSVSIPVVITIAKIRRLTDNPNSRSSHENPVPTLGGISVFAAILLSLTIWGVVSPTNGLQYVIGALVLIFFTGLKDDMLIIAPSKKLVSQILASAMIIIGANLRLESLHGIFGIYTMPYEASVIFTLFVFIVIINAYNLIDGIDGLAGSLGIMAALIFGTWFMTIGQSNLAILAFSVVGALTGFIRYNFSKYQKIFLGDTGSLIVGLMCAIFAVAFIQFNELAVGKSYYLLNAPIIAVAVLGIPLFDTLRVFINRIYHKRSPFSPDKNHIHHLLLRRNPSHKRATFILIIFNLIILIIISYFVNYLAPTAALCLILLFFGLYMITCYRLQSVRPRGFKSFCMRYMPPVYIIFWHKYLKD